MTTGMQAVLMWAALSFGGFLGHLVGDYLVQNGWMAANKAKPFFLVEGDELFYFVEPMKAITAHAASWTLSVQAFMLTLAWVAWGIVGATVAGYATLVLGAIHWVQDRRWPVVWFMKHTGKDPSQMWLLIVVDNVWHLLQIAAASAFVVWCMQ